MTAALFLDRDGVINEKAPEGRYITRAADFRFIPGVPEAIAELRTRVPELRIVVVTNQRGIARGLVTAETVDEINAAMRAGFRAVGADVDAVEVCPHEIGTCDCRKPQLGLFLRAIEAMPEIEVSESVVVGDSTADLEAGFRLGARTCLIGDPDLRARVRHDAAERGVPIYLEGPSLFALVADGSLVECLTGSFTPGVGTVATAVTILGTPDGSSSIQSAPGPGAPTTAPDPAGSSLPPTNDR